MKFCLVHFFSVSKNFRLVVLRGALAGLLVSVTACGPKDAAAGNAGGAGASGESAAAPAASSGGAAAASAPVVKDEPPLDHPAKVADATRLLDLSTLERMEGAEPAGQRNLAKLNYRVKSDIKGAYEFQKSKLASLKWREMPGTNVADTYASGVFTRGGFHVSITVMSSGQDGSVDIMLNQHGNVDFAKLPLPPEKKEVYVGPLTAMYTTEGGVPETAEACKKLMQAAGWQPYGGAGDSSYYKQNAVLVHVNVSAAPAQGGKTMISVNSELLSSDLPALLDAKDLRYSDSTGRLDYETPAQQDVVEKFYRMALPALGWEATLDKAVDIDGRDTVIFRNPEKAMITMSMKKAGEEGTNVKVEYLSPSEFAEMDRKATEYGNKLRAKHAEEMANKNKPLPVLKIKLPAGATGVTKEKGGLKFNVASGKAKTAVLAIRKEFSAAGFEETIAVLESIGGTVQMKKDVQSLSITYTDSGFSDGEVNVAGSGVEIEAEGGK